MLSLVAADLDYLSLASVQIIDFQTGSRLEEEVILPFSLGMAMGERVADDLHFDRLGLAFRIEQQGTWQHILVRAKKLGGSPLRADLKVHHPSKLESLNVVIPWSDKQFQFTSKQNSMPVVGTISHGVKTWALGEPNDFAWLDFGRGIWPYQSHWNWGTGVGRSEGKVLGLQFGSKWTDGTGATENGFLLDGRLHKISQRVDFQYDTEDFEKPWRLISEDGKTVNLTLEPCHLTSKAMDLKLMASKLNVCHGHFSGTVQIEGKTWPVKRFFGWAEEHIAKW